MRKIWLVILMFLMSHNTISAEDFTDIKPGMWAEKNIDKLVGKGAINGYKDGSFKPNNKIRIDEFIKLIISIKGYKIEKGQNYWAENYINKAIQLGYFEAGDFYNGYKMPITRGEMAAIISKALNEIYPDNLYENHYKSLSDGRILSDKNKDAIIKVFYKGIITGYPDGTFKEDNEATRAEAVTMLIRMIDPKERKFTVVKSHTSKIEVDDLVGLSKYPKVLTGSYLDSYDFSRRYSQDMLDENVNLMHDYIELENNFNYLEDGDGYIQKLSKIDNFARDNVQRLAENLVIKKSTFKTSKSLFYVDSRGKYCLRGILEYKYISYSGDEEVELEKTYLEDIEYKFIKSGNKLILWKKDKLIVGGEEKNEDI